MKYIDEFRDPQLARKLLANIRARSTQPVRFMEFCGGHTHAIFRHGLRQMLPPTVELRSGPGCPVCVTANAGLDRAIALAELPDVILTTFGDMLKVPGSHGSLQMARAEGADVRVVYSTLDALQIARDYPDRAVIFLGVGFETTAPTVAASILQAEAEGLDNFYVLSLHKLTPPATHAILDAGEVRLSGVIGPGHVTVVIGSQAWEFLPRDYSVPCAVAGFEPLDILRAVAALVEMAEAGRPAVVNTYSRSVRPEGNRVALGLMQRVFEVGEADWRGLGRVPASGLALRPEYARFDAARAFSVDPGPTREHKGCRCGDVLRACAAWYRYGEANV
jgi:hydrogenase expression/formation protein HypD